MTNQQWVRVLEEAFLVKAVEGLDVAEDYIDGVFDDNLIDISEALYCLNRVAA